MRVKISPETMERANHYIKGIRSKYDPEVHIPMLIELYSQGYSLPAFLVASKISEETFNAWVDSYPELANAYKDAKQGLRLMYEKMAVEGLNDPSFNTKLWSILAKNRADFTDTRKVAIPKLKQAKTHAEKFDVVSDSIANGELTLSEAQQIGNFLAVGAKIEDMTETARKVDELMAETFQDKT